MALCWQWERGAGTGVTHYLADYDCELLDRVGQGAACVACSLGIAWNLRTHFWITLAATCFLTCTSQERGKRGTRTHNSKAA